MLVARRQRRGKDVDVTADRAQLAVALELATAAHRGQVYPSPEREPYICHPIRVMQALEEGDEQIVALLHDVLEDTAIDVAELYELGFGEHIVRAVLLLTHDGTVPYADYIERLADDPLARRVKLADLADNLRNNRRLESTSGVRARINRYEAAQHLLEAWSRAG